MDFDCFFLEISVKVLKFQLLENFIMFVILLCFYHVCKPPRVDLV